jgi:hypothetical protein
MMLAKTVMPSQARSREAGGRTDGATEARLNIPMALPHGYNRFTDFIASKSVYGDPRDRYKHLVPEGEWAFRRHRCLEYDPGPSDGGFSLRASITTIVFLDKEAFLYYLTSSPISA